MVKVRILGISGTPVKDGNCDQLVEEALKAAGGLEGVETEFVTLADKKVAMCQHCQWCIENRQPCRVQDDAQAIYAMMEKADGLILGSPTWGETIAPPIINLFSRGRYYSFLSDKFRNKVVGAVTVGWFGFGMDLATATLLNYARGKSMIPVARAAAMSSTAAFGQRAAYMEHGVLDDKMGIARVRNCALRVVEVARIVRYAKDGGIVTPEAGTVTGGKPHRRKTARLVDGVWRGDE